MRSPTRLIASGLGLILASPAYALSSDLQDSVRSVRPEALPQEENLINFFLKIFNYLLGIVGLIAVVALIWHGFRLLTSEGGDGVKSARSSILDVALGIIVIGAAYTIVSWLINTVLGQVYN